jgi:hypothetical protein
MKKIAIAVFFIFLNVHAQNAADYFPSTMGTLWHFSSYLLDSLQQPIESSRILETDSIAGTINIDGKLATLIVTKIGALPESSYFAVEGQSLSTYVNAIPGIDSLPLPELQQFFGSVRGWYQYLRFGTSTGQNLPYLLLQRDTTLTLDSIPLKLRFMVTATRHAPQNISTPAGTFETVPFEISFSVNYMLGIFPIPIFKIPDTIYVAKNMFVVREAQPAIQFSSDTLGIAGLNIPGRLRVLDSYTIVPTAVRLEKNSIPSEFNLLQNYPNPFNGMTNYELRMRNEEHIDLKVYDMLGREVASLVEGVLQPGVYRIQWDARNIPSGVYYARLNSDQFSITRKTFLIK